MAEIAVFASGNGSNFQAIAEAAAASDHSVCCLICDQPGAAVLRRAESLNIRPVLISYRGKTREEAEKEIIGILEEYGPEFIVLAGFMKLISPLLLDAFPGKIINIHPSLLPRYPGTHAIERSFDSGDKEIGITIHQVDSGMDTGKVLFQKTYRRTGHETIDEIETIIHGLEHKYYPELVLKLLNSNNI